MTTVGNDAQLAALQRLLSDAHKGGQAKIDALVALTQRTVFVVPWPGDIDGYRTLVNSSGLAALPIFTSADQLEEAARRYGWLEPDGTAPRVELGARAALNHVQREGLGYAVIDIAAEHTLEVSAEEFMPLLSDAAKRDSVGPYAGAGRISSTMMKRMRASTPAPPGHSRPPVTPPSDVLRAPAVPKGDGIVASTGFDATSDARFGGASSTRVAAMSSDPPEAVFESLTTTLRTFPEVEWAAFCNAARGPEALVPSVAIRVDPGYRQRVNELAQALRHASGIVGASLQIIMVDDTQVMRQVRSEGLVFYPWRKK